jgi:uncharacterized protein (DUF1501 family)
MHRRHLLKALALTLPQLTVTGRLFAAPAGAPRFLLVFLRGGYDCANVLVPYSSSYYYEVRPSIAVPRPSPAAAASGAVTLDADWALAPPLRASIAPLYAQREALFIPFAGTEDVSRSHFETQDSIELGQPLTRPAELSSGFLARLAGVVSGAAPIAFTDSLPVALRGMADVPNVSLKGNTKPVFDARQGALLSAMYSGHHLKAEVDDGLKLRQDLARVMEQEMREANRGAITPKGFELEARRIGRLMREQYRIGFIDVGGWDTHVNEGAAQGALAGGIESLGAGLLGLSQELGPEWRNTLVAVISEFGRTLRENGNHGTDHGHGSVYWLLGGSINGGRIAGEQTPVARASLFQDRDYPVLNEYRALLSGLFRRTFGLSPEQLERVFPAATPQDLKLV